ncbi:MAG: 50S ribosomal protein L23 [Exilispira sp.]
MKLEYHDIIYKPAFNEKSTNLQQQNKYTFYIHQDANKKMVAEAVNKLFNVKVVDVNIVNLPRKPKQRDRFHPGYTNFRKKAIVTVAKGQKIKELIVE